MTRPLFTIRPRRSWSPIRLGEILPYRDLVRALALRDIKLRYRQTAFGVVWVVLQPLATSVVLAVVFSRVAGFGSGDVPYLVFAFAGMLCWNLFAETLTKSSMSLVATPSLISKVYFPRIFIPVAVVGSTMLDFLVASVVLAVLLAVNGIAPDAGLLMLPLWVALTLALALGFGCFFAAVTVRYRDVQYTLPVAMQLAFFASPVAYSVADMPAGPRVMLDVNPLSGVLEAFRWSIVGGTAPAGWRLAWSGVAAVGALAFGLVSFARMERDFADVI